MTATVTVDIAGAQMGGAARFAAELRGYLARSGRDDVRVIGASRAVGAGWLLRRETAAPARRRVALNNVSFVAPGGERWALLRNALHFLTAAQEARLGPALPASARRDAAVVRLAARRADVLVAPSTAMAERVCRALPGLANRVVVRPHPVSAGQAAGASAGAPVILCPVLFAPYKQMASRLAELLDALDPIGAPGGPEAGPDVVVRVTADRSQLPGALAHHPRLDPIGPAGPQALWRLLTASRAVFFPTGLESFGYPLAEARAAGRPVIARDTAQNAEIAGPALCGFRLGDPGSLRAAAERALTTRVDPDPGPFDPDAYFRWLLGAPR